MKNIILFLFFCLLFITVKAQLPANIGFEQGDLSTWQVFKGGTGSTCTGAICCPINACQLLGTNFQIPGRVEVATTGGNDFYSGMPVVSSAGGSYSLKLGNDTTGSQTEKVSTQFVVVSSDTLLTFAYATILQIAGHAPSQEPHFEIKVFDVGPSGSPYTTPVDITSIVAAQGIAPTYANNATYTNVQYSNWATYILHLYGLVGNVVQITFATSDCATGGHFGYSYVDFYSTASPLSVNVSNNQAICNGSSASITSTTSGGVSAYSYQWLPTAGLSSSTIANPSASPTVTTTYVLTVTDAASTIATDSLIITVNSSSSSSFGQSVCSGSSILFNGNNVSTAGAYNDTLVNYHGCDSIITMNLTVNSLPAITLAGSFASCTDTCIAVTVGGPSLVSWAWSITPITTFFNGSSLSQTLCFASSTTGAIVISLYGVDANSCANTTNYTVLRPTDCVWPGDVDGDLTANNLDIFPIGLLNGTTGTTRAGASTTWIDQPSTSWGISASGYTADAKHADCNGDGVINGNDTMAIVLNYGMVHQKPGKSAVSGLVTLNITPDTLYNNSLATAQISLGTAAVPLDSIYGIAFTFHFNPLVVDTNLISATVPPSWLFPSATDNFSVKKYNRSGGTIQVGLVRNDQVGKSGFGDICEVNMPIITDDIIGRPSSLFNRSYNMNCSVDAISILKLDGTIITTDMAIDSAKILYNSTSGIEGVNATIFKQKIQPNPATSELKLTANYLIGNEKVEVMNVLGEMQAVPSSFQNGSINMNVANLTAGVYVIKITDAANRNHSIRFVKN